MRAGKGNHMAGVAAVKDGQIVESASQNSLKTKEKAGGDMDKEAFLSLLVAQMQYQDPLEPTSNTEYISQYAQFSQVEAITNMSESMDMSRASSLVGKTVNIATTDSSGNTQHVQGKVDYVTYQGGKAYLSIDEALYSLDDVESIVDPLYQDAYDKAYNLNVAVNKLPAINNVTLGDGTQIEKLNSEYNSMSDYEKRFVASDVVAMLKAYAEKLSQVRAAAEETVEKAAAEAAAQTAETEGTAQTAETEETAQTTETADTAQTGTQDASEIAETVAESTGSDQIDDSKE